MKSAVPQAPLVLQAELAIHPSTPPRSDVHFPHFSSALHLESTYVAVGPS